MSPANHGSKREPTAEENDLAHDVMGAAIEVRRILGPGFLETVYEEAMALELTQRSSSFRRQYSIPIRYKNYPVGECRMDLLGADSLITKLKAVEAVAPIRKAQVIAHSEPRDSIWRS